MNIEGASLNVKVECEITPGIGIHLVGLADMVVKESLLRVVTAVQSLGYGIPGKKVVINVQPAFRKMAVPASGLDLPVAIALLVASGQLELKEGLDLKHITFYGELGLDGSIRDYGHGGHAVAAAAARHMTGEGVRPLLITGETTAMQACMVLGVKTYAFLNLLDVIRFLEGKTDGVKQLVWNTPTFLQLVDYAMTEANIEKSEARKKKDACMLSQAEF